MTLFFYDLLAPLGRVLFRITVAALRILGVKRGTKLIETLNLRYAGDRPAYELVPIDRFRTQRPIWIHAASGEFEYAKPIIRELQKISQPVFVTYFSPTYKKNIENFPGVTAATALPLESRSELRSMINRINPKALLISRTDTWPNMLRETAAAKIPTLLFSATFHEGSKRIGFFAKSLTKATFHLINEVQCVSSSDKALLAQIGIQQVKVCGDTRYDQVIARIESAAESMHGKLPSVISSCLGKMVLTAGSVWEEDIDALLPAISEIKAALGSSDSCTFLLVPHEIDQDLIAKTLKLARTRGLAVQVLSDLEASKALPSACDVLIVDRVGILAELYLLGQFAFVGGSFRKTVHSVMEPLAAGCLTHVGPLHRNNREAIEFQSEVAEERLSWSSVTGSKSSHELSRQMTAMMEAYLKLSSAEREDIRLIIRDQVKARGGATEAVLQWLKMNTASN